MAATTLASGSSTLATTTISFSAQPAGTMLVLTVTASDVLAGSGTGRPESTGWTRGPDGVDWNETAMFMLVAAGSETSVQYRIGSASPSVYNLVAYDDGFAGSPAGASSSLHTHNDSGAASTGTTGITPTSGSSWLVVANIGGSRDNASTFTNPASLTNSFTRQSAAALTSPDTYGNVQGFRVVTGGSLISTAGTWGGGGAKCTYGQLWAFQIAAGGTPVGKATTAALTGTGAVTAAGTVGKVSTAALTGSVAVSASGALAYAGTGSVAGVGAVTAAGVVGTASTVTVTGTGTITGSGSVTGTNTATINGAGSVTAAGVVAKTTTATLTGTGVVTATGVVGASSTVALAGTGTVTSSGVTATGPSATLTGTGTVSAAGNVGKTTTTTLTGSGAVSASGVAATGPSSTITGTGTVNATGVLGKRGTATITATANVTAAGVRNSTTQATIQGTAAITATGVVVEHGGDRDITVTGTLEPRRWAATLTPTVKAGSIHRRWEGTL